MNVGDYVRTKDGRILRYSGSNNAEIENFTIPDVKKSSPQIIDLIEIEDYVNGTIVTKVVLDSIECNYIELDYSYNKRGIRNKDIKTVVTHEQMEAMQYRVEE